MPSPFHKIATYAACAALVAATGAPAMAQSEPVFTFEISQAALQSGSGVADTYAALRQEVASYCAELRLGPVTQSCEEEVLAAAIAQIDHPSLSEQHILVTTRNQNTERPGALTS